MWSLNARLAVAASLVLAGVLTLTGWTLDRAFRQAALAGVEEGLRTQVYALLAAAELDESDHLVLPDVLPEARFSTPGSGLYAKITDAGGLTVWRSHSMLGREVDFPPHGQPGQALFDDARDSTKERLFTLSFAVTWELPERGERRFVFNVAQSQQAYKQQVAAFRSNLSGWFTLAVVILVAIQVLILRWGLAPLRRVAEHIGELEQGQRAELDERYPRELQPLTRNLNAFIRHEKAHLERYRTALADLAHALKTPLAVLRSSIDKNAEGDLSRTVSDQVERMDQAVEYQLRRAAASGRTTLAAPVDVEPALTRLRNSLDKVYADKGVNTFINVAPNSYFLGDEGDLMEILGNLMDNAYKWSRNVVRISTDVQNGRGDGLRFTLCVEDDGPGVPPSLTHRIARRGVRADRRVPGQGIGLAVVKELVEDVYSGRLSVSGSDLGGARVDAEIPFH